MKINLEKLTEALNAYGLTHWVDNEKLYITNPKIDTKSSHDLTKLLELFGILTVMHSLSPDRAIIEIVDLIIQNHHVKKSQSSITKPIINPVRQTGRTTRIINSIVESLLTTGQAINTDHTCFEFKQESKSFLRKFFIPKVEAEISRITHGRKTINSVISSINGIPYVYFVMIHNKIETDEQT